MSRPERYKITPEVFLLLIKNDKILLLRRFQTGWQDGNYGLPAGHGEDRETMREGAAREAREEIGLDIPLEDLQFALVQNRWAPDADNPHARIGFYFTAKRWSGEPYNNEPDKCDDLRWFPLDALPANTIDHVRAAIASYRAGEKYVEFNWSSLN